MADFGFGGGGGASAVDSAPHAVAVGKKRPRADEIPDADAPGANRRAGGGKKGKGGGFQHMGLSKEVLGAVLRMGESSSPLRPRPPPPPVAATIAIHPLPVCRVQVADSHSAQDVARCADWP